MDVTSTNTTDVEAGDRRERNDKELRCLAVNPLYFLS